VNDDEIDFDYSQTHLDDFLKSQTQNNLFKNSNVQSTQLLNTFLSSYNKMKSGQSFRNSLNKVDVSQSKMNPIIEKFEQSESEAQSKKAPEEDEFDEDLGRSGEKIDLNQVEVSSKNSAKKSKPILSQEQV